MSDTCLTIESATEGLYKEKGSRFLAFAYPVESEDQIKERLQALRKQHHAARHHCYAWILGSDGQRVRQNDDGEPSGTAGRPIMGQLKKVGLTNILAVVVRYFGGTLLGVSGLAKAYGYATADALQRATIIERISTVPMTVIFDYAALNSVMKLLKDNALPQNLPDFGACLDNRCQLHTSAPKSRADSVAALFRAFNCTVSFPADTCEAPDN
ncbi:MAG: YigZ family protein [Bacteroidales bacterium]|jgi:uncharacterized YigZ family protein|nr:YigZ family protein [Bacteroidales bacterium]